MALQWLLNNDSWRLQKCCYAFVCMPEREHVYLSYVKSMSSGPGKGSRGQLTKQLRKTRQAQPAQTSRMEMKVAPRS